MAIRILVLGFLLTVLAGPATAATPGLTCDFDEVSLGEVPPGWVVAATNAHGPLATWQVLSDQTAPTGKQVLALTNTNGNSDGSFNLCWTDSVAFADGIITVQFKAVSGREDQGGGVIWRAQDADNYLIARFNPLEDNFRLYSVQKGRRHTLASAQIALESGQWHTMRITQQGEHYTAGLDGQKLLAGDTDRLSAPGGVGLWTKADAATRFDNFTVVPGSAEAAQ